MERQIAWFIAGIVFVAGSGMGLLSVFLFIKNGRMKQRLCELMRDKGALSMQVSILEEVLKEKERQ